MDPVILLNLMAVAMLIVVFWLANRFAKMTPRERRLEVVPIITGMVSYPGAYLLVQHFISGASPVIWIALGAVVMMSVLRVISWMQGNDSTHQPETHDAGQPG